MSSATFDKKQLLAYTSFHDQEEDISYKGAKCMEVYRKEAWLFEDYCLSWLCARFPLNHARTHLVMHGNAMSI